MNREHEQLWKVVSIANFILGNPEIAGRIPPSMNVQYRQALAELHRITNLHVQDVTPDPAVPPKPKRPDLQTFGEGEIPPIEARRGGSA